MPFRINCPKCQTPFVCPDENRGKRLQCSKCGQQFLAGSAPAASDTSAAVQAQPNRAAAPAPRRVAPPVSTPNAESTIAVKRSPAIMILAGLAAALIIGVALGSIGTYLIMRGKETAPTASQPEQLAQATTNTSTEKQKNPVAEQSTPSKQEATPADTTPQKIDEEDLDKPAPKTEPKQAPAPVPPPVAQTDPPVNHGGTLGRKATAGTQFTYQLSLPSGKAKYAKLEGPTGMEISEDGLLQWTPERSASAREKFGVRVNNAMIHYYWIDVVGTVANTQPKAEPKPQPKPSPAAPAESVVKNGDTLPKKAVAGQPYSFRLQPADGKNKYALTSGPKGLQLSPEGVVEWTPPKGTFGKQDILLQINSRDLHRYTIIVEDPVMDRIVILPLEPPSGWVMTPDGVTLITSIAESAQLVYFDTVAGKEVKRVEVEFQPGSLALQGDTLFAAGKGSSTVYALDAKTAKVKKEYSVGSDAVARIACHPEKGLVYATTVTFGVFSIDPESGKVTKTAAKGLWIAVDPIKGQSVVTGLQPKLRDEFIIRGAQGNEISIFSDTWGHRAMMMRYAVAGNDLKTTSVQDNAACNGWDMHMTPDGKRVMVVGGGGWRPKDGSNQGGYVVAAYSAENLESMVGQAPHGLNVAFHPVLNLGVTNHYGLDLTLFNGRSLAKRATIPISKSEERRPLLLTFGGKGTKIVLWNGNNPTNRQGLQFIPLDLSAEDRGALEKKYGKLPAG